MRKIIVYFRNHGMVTNWFILLVMVTGVFGFTQLRRRVWPQEEKDQVDISASWPGVSALEIEDSLTIHIEGKIKGIEGVERMTSTTGDGVVDIRLDTSPKIPIDKIVDRVRTAVKEVPNYPKDAQLPVVSQAKSWNRAMMLLLYGTEDLDVLQEVADDFRTRLLGFDEVSKINSWGLSQKEILVNVSPALLREHSLTADDIEKAILSSDLNIVAGSVQTGAEVLEIRSYGRRTTVEAIAEIPVLIKGERIPLGQICGVSEERPENAVYTRVNGRVAVGFDIMYTNEEDVLVITKIVDDLIEEAREKYGDLVVFAPLVRDADAIKERLGTLGTSGLMGLLLVVLILGLFLNLRLSLWVAFGIPFSFLGLFIIEWILDITINEMSLFGMIMLLGILVDDGIIIGENIWTHWKNQGKSPLQAALDGTLEVLGPVTVSIVTTMVAFAPYFFIYGFLGQYTGQIALVIILCLLFSLVESAIILPVHLSHSKALANRSARQGEFRRGLDRFQEGVIHKVYAPVLRWTLAHRGVALAIMASAILVLMGAMAGQHVKMAIFPEVEAPFSVAEISFPAGTSAAVVDKVRAEVTETGLALGREEEWARPESGYNNAVLDVLSWGDTRLIDVYFFLIPNKNRDYPAAAFTSALNENVGSISEAESVKIGVSAFGGYPIAIRFVGEGRTALSIASKMLKEELAQIEGVKDISDDTPLGARELVFSLSDRGQALGLSPREFATQIREGWYGKEVTRITDGPRQIPVVMRMDVGSRRSLNQLDRYPIRTPTKEWVLAGDVMDYGIERGVASIRRENGFRSVQVNAGFDSSKGTLNVVLEEINTQIVPRILAEVPGISLATGGQAAEVERIRESMLYAMITAFIIIFTILMVATSSVGQAIVIVSLIPLGFVGAVIGHILLDLPLSFFSYLGVLALAGIIINDSVVFISTYNRLVRTDGLAAKQAAFNTGLKRFRPILMTTLTTSIGLGPLIFQKSVGGQLLIPIAVSVAFGLIFGTFLTLILLPCVLSLMADFNERILAGRNRRRTRRGETPGSDPVIVTRGGS